MGIYMTARFQVKLDAVDKCEQAIEEFIAYIKANEPDTLFYTSVRQASDPTSFLHFFHFKDQAARQKHSSSDGVNRFTSILYPELVAPVEFTEYTLLATTS